MPPSLLGLIGGSVLLSSGSQIVLKFGMTSLAVQSALTQPIDPARALLAIATSPLVVGGLGCFGLSAVLWLFVLSKVSLSSAYPFVALGIVITVAAGRFLLGEPVAAIKLIGVALIVTGVFAVAAGT